MSNLLEYLQAHEDAFKSRNRLASLYSSFHTQRANNPEGYAANAAVWLSALTKLSRSGLLPPLQAQSSSSTASALGFASGPALARALSTKEFGQPLALGSVINEAIHKGDLIPLQPFLASEKSIYHKPWIKLPSPVQVITWGLTTLGLTSAPGTSDKLLQGSYVVRANVEAAATNVVAALANRGTSAADRIIPRLQFEKEFASALGSDDAAQLSSTDFTVLLRYLNRDRPVLAFSKSTVKVAASGQNPPEPVTAQDENIANLRGLITSLAKQVDALQDKVATLDREARTAVANKQTTKAKLALRQRKAAEGLLEQRSRTLETLEQTWQSIEVAADNVAIVQAMRDSKTVLKSLNAAVGGTEGVDEVVEQLREQMDVAGDVNSVVTEGARVHEIDEGEVDDELEALEKVEKDKLDKAEREARERKEKEATVHQEAREREDESRTKEMLEGLSVPTHDPGQHEQRRANTEAMERPEAP